jgi:hypothetical protein
MKECRECERLKKIIDALEDVVAWYETDNERETYDDEDIPSELAESEKALEIARSKYYNDED